MRRALFLIPLLGAQVLSVEHLGEVGIWRRYMERSTSRLEQAFSAEEHATMEGHLTFLAEAHTRLGVEYGQISDFVAIAELNRFWRDAPLIIISRLGIGLDGRLEGTLSRITLPHDDLLGGKYEHWILNVANLTDEIIPPTGWEVRLHLRDGTVLVPASPDDPGLAGTTAALRPGRHLWRDDLYPDTNIRVILLLPPVVHAEILALEFTLGGSTVWIPWWENIL